MLDIIQSSSNVKMCSRLQKQTEKVAPSSTHTCSENAQTAEPAMAFVGVVNVP